MKLPGKQLRRDSSTIAMGDCFRWAYRDVIAHGGTLVQGLVVHPWSKKAFEHAWVERKGHAYDWQTIVLRQQPAMTLSAFTKAWKPHQTTRYSPKKAARELLLQKNFGPWETCIPISREYRDPSKLVHIITNTATLARAMFPEGGLPSYNEGVYKGTKFPIRKLTGRETVKVIGTTTGAKVVSDETWIIDRFGPVGARQIKRLREITEPSRTRRDPPKLGPYLLLINRDQEDHALDEKHTQIVDINPRTFLDLTTEHGADDFIRTADGIIDVNFYNSPAIQQKIRVHPHLSINAQTGQVTGHEGRHRAASVLQAGGPWFRASIKLTPSSRNYKPEQMPQRWTGQFNRNVTVSVPRLLTTDRLRIIDNNVQRQYQKR